MNPQKALAILDLIQALEKARFAGLEPEKIKNIVEYELEPEEKHEQNNCEVN